MASGIDTARAEAGAPRSHDRGLPGSRSQDRASASSDGAEPRLWFGGSRLGRLILGLNLIGLVVLIVGALVLNEFRRGLIEARIDSLTTQGELISYVIVKAATVGDPRPAMDADEARDILQLLAIPRSERARLSDARGRLIADTDVIADKVVERPLPPARATTGFHIVWPWAAYFSEPAREARAHAQEQAETRRALSGVRVAGMRTSETGGRLVSVSIPIQHVKAVLGVLTLEAGDVDRIVAAQRAALAPFILIAVAASLGSSLLLTGLVAEPVRRLARAADSVRLSRARAISLPDISEREDEVGDLARSLESMTSTLSARMDAIDRFAADVSHEIKNPLASLRSAVETLELAAPDSPARARLMAILKQDVRRMDRLITDISNASRLDAELSRDPPHAFDLGRFLADVVALYPEPGTPDTVGVRFQPAEPAERLRVTGREGSLGQVFRNLIDNARSFSPDGGTVRVGFGRGRAGGPDRPGAEGDRPGFERSGFEWSGFERFGSDRDRASVERAVIVTVDDDGPGIPADNLQSIFERFYTERPKGATPGGAAFGGHSGLGLSIARQIVEAHGGRIWAENRTDEAGRRLGARFGVELPEARGDGARAATSNRA